MKFVFLFAGLDWILMSMMLEEVSFTVSKIDITFSMIVKKYSTNV